MYYFILLILKIFYFNVNFYNINPSKYNYKSIGSSFTAFFYSKFNKFPNIVSSQTIKIYLTEYWPTSSSAYYYDIRNFYFKIQFDSKKIEINYKWENSQYRNLKTIYEDEWNLLIILTIYSNDYVKITGFKDSYPRETLFNLYKSNINDYRYLYYDIENFDSRVTYSFYSYYSNVYIYKPDKFYNIDILNRTNKCNTNEYSDLNGNCLACPVKDDCKICYGENGEYCLECNNDNYLLSPSNICCSRTCSSCWGYKDYCISCKSGYKIIIANPYNYSSNNSYEICGPLDDKYFFDEELNINKKCSNKCVRCYKNKDYCFKCNESEGFIEDSIIYNFGDYSFFSCVCKDGLYYDSVDDECKYCHKSCLTCNGPNSNNCLSCGENFINKISENNTCECKSGYFIDETRNSKSYRFIKNVLCNQCHPLCKTCNGRSKNNCLTCDLNVTNSDITSNNTCKCLDGYYFKNILQVNSLKEICLPCYDNGCKSCNGTKISDCTECFPDFINYTDSDSNYRCKCNLSDKKIKSELSIYNDQKFYKNYTCTLDCHISCNSCFGNNYNNCINCNEQIFIYDYVNNQCICKDGFYADYSETSEKNICKPCHFSCKTCNGENNNNCLSCESSFNFSNNNECLCNSPNQIYKDDDLVHLLIPIKQKCISCNSNQTYDFDLNQCENCHKNCLTCNGINSNNCTSCKSSFINDILNGNCLCNSPKIIKNKDCVCPDSFHWNGTNCSKCYELCKTCNGSNSSHCLSCYDDFTLSSGSCMSNNSFFTTYSKYNDLPTYSKSKCYLSCNSCETYDYLKCKTCDSLPFKILNSSPNKCLCKDGYYFYYKDNPKNYNEICLPCHKTCKTCYGPLSTQCLSCPLNFIRNYSKQTCNCDIENSKYIDYVHDNLNSFSFPTIQRCYYCHNSCQTCDGSSLDNCLSCKLRNKNFFLINNKCLCPYGHYSVGTNCNRCYNKSCKECDPDNPNNCISCFQNATLSSNTCNCNSGFYSYTSTTSYYYSSNRFRVYYLSTYSRNLSSLYFGKKLCIKCNGSCLECNGPSYNNCTSCDNSLTLSNLIINRCNCKDSYFWNSNSSLFYSNQIFNNVCKTCDTNCWNCNDEYTNSCISCKNTNFSIHNNICSCSYYDYYLDNTVTPNECKSCHKICYRCNGPNYNECIECNLNYTINDIELNNTCKCKQGFYFYNSSSDTSINDFCLRCHYTCRTCNGPNETDCTSCSNNFINTISTNGKCSCNDGYYPYLFDYSLSSSYLTYQQCRECNVNSTCKTCINFDKCLSCKNGCLENNNREYTYNSVVYNIMECNKPNKYYIDTNDDYSCKSCFIGCVECNNSGNENCLKNCDNGYKKEIINHTTSKIRCYCPDGYFIDTNDQECKPCHKTCRTCNEEGVDKCLSCFDFFKKKQELNNKYSCICDNKSRYIEDRIYNSRTISSCYSCYKSCTGCLDDKIDSCLKCDEPFSIIKTLNKLNPLTNLNIEVFECSCGGYIDIDKTCQNCFKNCDSCLDGDKTSCKTCINDYKHIYFYTKDNFNLGTCIRNCKLNEYNIDDDTCGICHEFCNSCFGPNKNNCLNCNSDRFFENNNCYPICDIKYYLNRNYNYPKCDKCDESCLTCTDKNRNNCTSCNYNLFEFNKGYCNRKCDNGNYLKFSTNTCEICNSLCNTCKENSINCTSCNKNFILDIKNLKCNCNIKNGYFLEKNKCNICNINCETCKGHGNNNCIKCKSNSFTYYENDIKGNKLCIYKCPDYYSNNTFNECFKCHSDCLLCKGLTRRDCLTCPKLLTFYENKCLFKCPDGYVKIFYEGINYNCDKCEFGCKKCDYKNKKKCLICMNNFFKIFNECSENCPLGYYKDYNQNICKICENKCQNCDDYNKCDYCKEGYILLNGKCYTNCPEGYIRIKNIYCIKIDCYKGCKICKDKNNCSKCNKNYLLYNNRCIECKLYNGLNDNCIEKCGDGFRYNNIHNECDDGNRKNNDGCDENCKIEKGYLCRRSNYRSPDLCFKKTKIEVNLYELNKIKIEFDKKFINKIKDFEKNIIIYNDLNDIVNYNLIFNESNNKLIILELLLEESFEGFIKFKENNNFIMFDENKIEIDFNKDFYIKYNKNNSIEKLYKNLQKISKIAEDFNLVLIYVIMLSSFVSSKLPKFNLNILQRFLFIKMLNINFPPLIKEYLNLIGNNIDFEKLGFNSNENENGESRIDIFFGINKNDQKISIKAFSDLKFSNVFLKKGIIFFLLIFLQYYIIKLFSKYFENKKINKYNYLVRKYNPNSKKYMFNFK